jgi:hypothetical protein
MLQIRVKRSLPDRHPYFARDRLRREVLGTDEGDDARQLEPFEGEIANGARRFKSDSLTPERPVDEVANLGLLALVDSLENEGHLASRLFGGPVDDEPEPVAVPLIALALLVQPAAGFFPRIALRIEAHDVRVGEHLRDEVEIRGYQLPEPEPFRLEDHVGLTRARTAPAGS